MGNKIIKSILITFLMFVIVSATTVNKVYATSSPTFPSCQNPSGQVIVQYQDGIHGVAGDSNAYTGTDIVYKVTESSVIQCLCSTSGNGIQTNWWKISSLTAQEIEDFKTEGWIFVPNGSVWGLEDDPYLARNMKYSCIANNKGGDSEGSGGGGSSSGNSSNTSSSVTGQVLGLATTGNSMTLYLLFTTGILLLITGIYLQRVYPRQNE